MSADISFLNGNAEAAFALKPAWWDVRNEYVLDHIPNSEEMIRAAHLDWHVDLQPVYNREGQIIPGFATSIRTDTGLHLGIMSDSYRVVQNADAFTFLDGLLKDGIMRYESAGALRGGRTVWALARMPSVDEIAEGDQLNRYVLWLNSHDAVFQCGERNLDLFPLDVHFTEVGIDLLEQFFLGDFGSGTTTGQSNCDKNQQQVSNHGNSSLGLVDLVPHRHDTQKK